MRTVLIPAVNPGVSKDTIGPIVNQYLDGILGGSTGQYGPVWTASVQSGLIKQAGPYVGYESDTLAYQFGFWTRSSFLQNTGSIVTVNLGTNTPSTFPFQVYSSSTSTSAGDGAIIKNPGSYPTCLGVINSVNQTYLANCGATDNWFTGAVAGDTALRWEYGKVGHFGPHGSGGAAVYPTVKIDSTGIGIGITSNSVGAMIHSIIGSTSTKGLLIKGIASQTSDYFDFQNSGGTSQLKLNSSGQLLQGGLSTFLSLYTALVAGGFEARRATSGGVITASTDTFQTSGNGIAGFFGATASGGSGYNAFRILGSAAENQSTTALGTDLNIATVKKTTTAYVNRLLISSEGNIVTNANQSALATNATDGFLYIPTCAGTPTGAPTAYTGNGAMVYDTTNNKLYVRNGAAWKSVTLA